MTLKSLFELDNKIPITWVLSMLFAALGALFGALIWAGWNARELTFKLESGIARVDQFVEVQSEINARVLKLEVKDQIKDAFNKQIENRVERLESK